MFFLQIFQIRMIILHITGSCINPCIIHIFLYQKASCNSLITLSAQYNGCVIERGKNDPILQTIFADHINDLLFHTTIIINTVLQLDVCDQIFLLCHPLQILSQSRNLKSAEFSGKLIRITAIQFTQLSICKIIDIPVSICGTVNLLIVHDHRNQILGQLYIKLDPLATSLHSLLKRQHCILRIFSAETTMSKYFHSNHPPFNVLHHCEHFC